MSKILSRRDLDFLMYEWLRVDDLVDRPRFAEHSRETFDAFMDLSTQVATRHFANHNALNDQHEPTFDGERVHIIPEVSEALAAYNEAGLLAASADEELGGLQIPQVVHRACIAWFQAANTATAAYSMLTFAAANLLVAHGNQEQIDRYVRPMFAGRFFGTMCLSEPEAGSSLADVSTKAAPVGDGTYRVQGTKMWISGGEHDLSENIVHLVLARHAGGPAGVKGLSLFVVPKFLVNDDGSLGERNDVSLAGLNHKMGYRGTTNTVLNFGDGSHRPGIGEGAVGYLIGDEGAGLRYMFHMMNEARVGVGASAVALGYTGYLHALDYARTRLQGRPLTERDDSAPQIPIIRHADVRRMLLASKSYVEGGMGLALYAARLLDEEQTAADQADRHRAHLLLDVLTPIVKSWPSQWCLVANDHAIQIHGGYGYTRDYPVEQFYRDNRLNPIHEGTHGIQAQDILGRKVTMDGGAGLALLVETMSATARAAEPDSELAPMAQQLLDSITLLVETTQTVWAGGDRAVALANASAYLEAVGHVVMAWIWLEQALACAGKVGDFYDGKRLAARYFFSHELPRVRSQFELVRSRNTLLMDLDDSCL